MKKLLILAVILFGITGCGETSSNKAEQDLAFEQYKKSLFDGAATSDEIEKTIFLDFSFDMTKKTS